MRYLEESKPNRKLMDSSMQELELPFVAAFDKPRKVVVHYRNGMTKVAENVVEFQVLRDDIVFVRWYNARTAASRPIRCPYRSRNIVRLELRTSWADPARNYFLEPC
jgi:hypothetical protein